MSATPAGQLIDVGVSLKSGGALQGWGGAGCREAELCSTPPAQLKGRGLSRRGGSSAKLGYQVLASGSGGQVSRVLSPPISSTVDRTKERRE